MNQISVFLNFGNISIIISGLVNLFLGIFILAKRRNNASAVSFAFVTLTFVLWSITILGLHVAEINNDPAQTLWGRLTYVSGLLIATAYFIFACTFPGIKFPTSKKFKVASICTFVFLLCFIPLIIMTGGVAKIIGFSVFPKYMIFGPLYPVWLIFMFTYLGIALFLFSRTYRHSTGVIHAQSFYIFLGFLFTVLWGGTTNIILPTLGNYNFYAAFGPVSSLFIVFFVAYGILKYRLLDIRIIIRESTIILGSILITIGVTIAFYFVLQLFAIFPAWADAQLSIVLAAFLLLPIKKALRFIVNRFLFASLYSYHETIRALTRKLVTILSLPKLAEMILQVIMATMNLTRAAILLRSAKGQQYKILHTVGFSRENGISLLENDFLTHWLEGSKVPLVYEEIEFMIREEKDVSIQIKLKDLQHRMKEIDAAVCLPLFSHNKISGLIVLDHKHSGEAFSVQDIELLETLVIQASIAIENARLYQDLQNLTQNLQNKVDEQTKDIKKLYNEKNEFLHLVSHQLRSPLTALRGYVALMYEEDFESLVPFEKQKIKKRIFDSCENMASITNAMLDTLNLDRGRLRFNFDQHDIWTELVRIANILKPHFEQKGLALKIEKPPTKIPALECDKQYLIQVFQNLIDNALKYTKTGGLAITARKIGGDQIEINFQDTGIGLTKKDIRYLFKEKFYRGENANTVNTKGVGLGLYHAAQIVKGHRGTIIVKSEGKNKGSDFIVTLPIKQGKGKI